MDPEKLARTIEDFLLEAPDSVVLEDGEAIFDLATSRYTVTVRQGKCLLHLWSEERNALRRVFDLELRQTVLRLQVQKFGQVPSTTIEICQADDRRNDSTRKVHRSKCQRLLGRVLRREFPGYVLERLSSAMDLERSFGPVYTRALIRKGRTAFAVIGVNDQETQAAVDGVLTFGLLWLNVCRDREASNVVIEGLKLFLPPQRSAVVRSRLAHLNHTQAKFQIFELEELDERANEFDSQDAGNIATRLVRCPDRAAALARFAASISRIRTSVPDCEVVVHDPTEIAFRLHGLEFARARLILGGGAWGPQQAITFATGRFETTLTPATEHQFEEIMARLCASRRPDRCDRDALWRMQPERWLESLILKDVSALDDRLDGAYVYSQVPAFAATDRAMIDVLTSTHSGQLAVIELKADEDIHLPLQGLDYWARVQWHHERGDFNEFGYFPGKALSAQSPYLLLAAPALRVHSATDTLLSYLNPQIHWTLVGLDENWRNGVKVVFRKRSSGGSRRF